jgi:pimeloyl-ACP methyl ester carboxylesterase
MEMEFQPEDRWFTDGDLRLHYLDWGNPKATPMVLLHGHTSHAHYWDFFARSMRQGYHVIAVDQRGHGDSGWMESYRREDYVADLAKIVDKLGLSDIVLIGHSMGGANVIAYTVEHPGKVARLVLVDMGPVITTEAEEERKKRISAIPEAYSSEEEAISIIGQLWPYYSEDFIRHEIKHSLKRDESGRLIHKYDPALFRVGIGSLDWMWGYLEKIVCPTLLIRGAQSLTLLPEVARKMVEVLPSGTTIEIESAGHWIMGDNPEAFESAVRQFLQAYRMQSG